MFEYYPWSSEVLSQSLKKYSENKYTILDIELGGACNYNCIYCDSPDRKLPFQTSIKALRKIIESREITWLFICGLGEPTASANYTYLIDLLQLCEENGVKCSIFTNLSTLTDQMKEFVMKGVLYLIFKYDTLESVKVREIYNATNADDQIMNINELGKYVICDGQHTNIAASIVPSRRNIHEVKDVVKKCIDIGFFPLIGELENSGKACDVYDDLRLNNSELVELKKEVELLLGEEYKVPICPSVISGVHVNYCGDVVVDKLSGLSCNWFWLEEPKLESVAKFSDDIDSLENIIGIIENCRISRLKNVIQVVTSANKEIFGGCGGNSVILMQKYLEIITKKLRK